MTTTEVTPLPFGTGADGPAVRAATRGETVLAPPVAARLVSRLRAAGRRRARASRRRSPWWRGS